jgi:hypothetical protein
MKYKAGQMVYVVSVKPGPDNKPQIVVRNGAKQKFKVIHSGNKYSKLEPQGGDGNTPVIRIENTRIRQIEQQGGTMPNPKAEKPKAAKVKPKKVKKKQTAASVAKIEKVNLKKFKKRGDEVWINDFSDSFNSERADGSKIKAQAVCIIFKDKKKCQHFNLFDGTLGRVPVGARAKRKDKKTKKMIETIKQFGTEYNIGNYDRKIRELKKKGYKRYTAAV